MKIGEDIVLTRLQNDLYKIQLSSGDSYVGSAASTIVTLSKEAFMQQVIDEGAAAAAKLDADRKLE